MTAPLTANDHFRIHMPYCFWKLEHPYFKHVWLPVNRNYGVLGTHDHSFDRKADVMSAFVFSTDPNGFKCVWTYYRHPTEDVRYLYNGSIVDNGDYFSRLRRLFEYKSLTVETAELQRARHRAMRERSKIWGF